jgi:hypothetical protein
LDHVRNGLIAEGKLGTTSLTLQTFDNLNLTTQQLKQLSSYAPGQLLEAFRYQPSIDLAPGRYEVRGIDLTSKEVEVARNGERQRFDPAQLSSNAKGLALKVPGEIEVREGDKLIWTTNDKAKDISNGSPIDVLKIEPDSLTVGNAKGEWKLEAGDPLSQSLAHGLVLNMHRAQGMTYDKTISVMDSHDRMLNSASLFYVLNSRAREDSAIHLDNKDAVARSIESHRGSTPNALDLCPELAKPDTSGLGSKSGVDAQLDRSLTHAALEIMGLKSSAEPSPAAEPSTKTPELKIPEPERTRERDFDMDI